MKIAAAIDAHLQTLRVERRLSELTGKAYARDLSVLREWLAAQAIDDCSAVTPSHIRSLLASEHARGLSAKSLQRLLSAIRGLFDGLLRRSLLPASPVEGIRAPRAARSLPNVLDVDEMDGLLDLPEGDALASRDRAMLELFYSSALRLSELCNLRWSDLDLDEGLVRVLGKGSRTRIVPVGAQAREALHTLRAEMPPSAITDPVFLSRRGGPLSPRAVQARVRHWAQVQGVWKRVHPHLLRHSCASHVLESSGDLRGVQELLGHADIGTTQIYTHLDFQHLAKVYDAAHPRARKRSRD